MNHNLQIAYGTKLKKTFSQPHEATPISTDQVADMQLHTLCAFTWRQISFITLAA